MDEVTKVHAELFHWLFDRQHPIAVERIGRWVALDLSAIVVNGPEPTLVRGLDEHVKQLETAIRVNEMKYDPITVADRLRWAREHYKDDCTQPRDLADLLLRAAETLERTVPMHWRTIATIQSLVLIGFGIFVSR